MSKSAIYIGVFLNKKSKDLISKNFGSYVPDGWGWFNHHMTVKFFGKPVAPENFPEPYDKLAVEHKQVDLIITHIGISDNAIAIKVIPPTYMDLPLPHITLATPTGTKPVASNNIRNWKEVPNVSISGIIAGNLDADTLINEVEEESDTLVPFKGERRDSLDGTDPNEQAWAAPTMHVKMGNTMEETVERITKDVLKETISTFPFNVGTVENTYDAVTDRPGDMNKMGVVNYIDQQTLAEIEHTDISKLDFVHALEKAGGKVYQVGGAVRDEYLGKVSKDLDIMVSGLSEKQVFSVLRPLGVYKVVGQSFGVILFKPHGSEEFIDVALARSDKKVGDGHKGIQVTTDPSISVDDDLIRRDFTINSIAKDIHGNITDPYNGVQDLKNKIIRMTSPESFGEDPLRMLRAIQFAARFGFDIEPETFNVIKQKAPEIRTISPERILEEFNKIIGKGNPAIGGMLLDESGVYKYIFDADYKGVYGELNKVKTLSEFLYVLMKDSVDIPSDYYVKFFKDYDNLSKQLRAFELTRNNITTPAEQRWLLSNASKISPEAVGSFIIQDKLKDVSNDQEGKYPLIPSKIDIQSDDIHSLGIKGEKYGVLTRDLMDLIYKDELPNEREAILNYIKQNADKYKPDTEQVVKEITETLLTEMPAPEYETFHLFGIDFDVAKAYRLIESGDIKANVVEIDTFDPMKFGIRVNDDTKKVIRQENVDFSKPQGLWVKFDLDGETQSFPIDGNHRMYVAYKNKIPKIKAFAIIGIEDVSKISEVITRLAKRKSLNEEETITKLTKNILEEYDYSDAINLETTLLKAYGATDNPNVAGFITPSGHMLDFSGGGDTRGQDHRNISHYIDALGFKADNRTDAMNVAKSMGFIRFSPESNGFDMATMPTQEQFELMRSLIRKFNGNVVLDLGEGAYMQYEKGTPVEVVFTDIKNYYKHGMKPQPYKYADDEELYETITKLTKNILEEMVKKNFKNTIWRLSIFDMDGCLIDSPLPKEGKPQWEEKKGKKYPNRGWWSFNESLDTEVFDIKAYPSVVNKFNEELKRKDTIVVVMTNRLGHLEPAIKKVLHQNSIRPHILSTAEYPMQNKGHRVIDILQQNPNIKYISFYDDDESNLNNVRQSLKGQNITYDIYQAKGGNISKS